MSLHPVGQTAQLCSGCEPQMTPAVEEPAFQRGVYLADQYVDCDPKRQCCLASPATAVSWWSDFSLASGSAIGALAMSRTIRETWNDAVVAAEKAKRLRPGVDMTISINAIKKKEINQLIENYLKAAYGYDQLAYAARKDNNVRLVAYALGEWVEMLFWAEHYNGYTGRVRSKDTDSERRLNGYRIEHARTKIALNARAIVKEMLPALDTDRPVVGKATDSDSEADATRILAGADILRTGRQALADLDKFEDEVWKNELMERYNREIEEAFSRSLALSETNIRKAVVERKRGEFYTEAMKDKLKWYERAQAREWKQRYLNEARDYAEKAIEAFRSAYARMMGEQGPTARDFFVRIRILKKDAAVLETMAKVDKDFKRGDLEKVYKEIVSVARRAGTELMQGGAVAEVLDERHLLPVVLAEQIKAMEKLGQTGGEDYAAADRQMRSEGPTTLEVLDHLDLLNPEDRELALDVLKYREGMGGITTTAELMEALAFGRLRGALRKKHIAGEVISRLERSASDHLAVTLGLRFRDREARRAVK